MNLHSFSSRGSSICRSLFLRTFMVMMLFITGSNGIYAGVDLYATLSQPASHGTWNKENNQYSWDQGWDNLMPIFSITKGTLNTDYVALKFTTSNYRDDRDKYRVCFMNGDALVKTVPFESAGEMTIKLSTLGDLSQVDKILFGGNSDKGSITLDPNSIVLVGQLQNNTKRYDFSNFTLTNQGAHVQSAEYIKSEDALKVTTEWAWDNYFPLYKDLNGTNSTGVRVTARGVKFRIIAKTSDEKEKSFKVNVPESNGYVTRHYKWEDFVNQSTGAKMTEADVEKITQIGLAGDNDDNNATNMVFYVSGFWLDDIADYDKTIPCYGEEGGKWDWAKSSFVYKTAGATAVFEESKTRDANHNIILNGNNKVTLSSDVSKFTEVCLVFGDKTTYNLTVAGKSYTGTSTALICPVSASELTIQNNSSSAIYLSKIIYSSEKVGINEEREITVDGKTRKYWLYVPATLAGQENVPVVFSLHGRSNNDNPNQGGKPVFTSLANEKGFIVVYPQGRNAGDEQDKKDYPGDDWKKGFGDTTGWEATGK